MSAPTLLLSGGRDATGARLDVRADAATGRIAETGDALRPGDREQVVDCAGLVVLPAPAEPHAHLDKALSADRAPNPAGDLRGAIDAWRAHRPSLTHEDLVARGRAAAEELVAHGATAIRSHVDVGEGIGLRAIEAICAVRDELAAAGLAEVQVVALVSAPLGGPDGAAHRAMLEQAMEAGADVVGGCPHVDPDPVGATRAAFAVAQATGKPLDLHTDETLDPSHLWLEELIALAERHGPGAGVTASHCVSLGVQPEDRQRRIARALAAAPISVVTLPHTNLYLQARGRLEAPPRGLTALRPLLDAGAVLAAGADNVRDPFNPLGRSDPLETAALCVWAGHLTPAEAWWAVSGASRAALGLEAVALREGAPAELLATPGAGLPDALARAGQGRVVVHRGRLVAHTRLEGGLLPAAAPAPDPRPLATATPSP